MELTNDEAKLLEKYREMKEKNGFREGERISRSFTIPDPMDSDVLIDISLMMSARSSVPSTGSAVVADAIRKIVDK